MRGLPEKPHSDAINLDQVSDGMGQAQDNNQRHISGNQYRLRSQPTLSTSHAGHQLCCKNNNRTVKAPFLMQKKSSCGG